MEFRLNMIVAGQGSFQVYPAENRNSSRKSINERTQNSLNTARIVKLNHDTS